MKILDIKLNPDVDNVMCFKDKSLQLYSVRVKVKKWLRKEQIISCYPTAIGPTYWGPDIVFYYYIDENGKRLSDDLSEQINNWCRVQNIKTK